MNEPAASTRDTTNRVTRHDVVSVIEAAATLGITPDAVRARLRRGSLAGEKQGTTWMVHLDTSSPRAEEGYRATRHDTPRDVMRQRERGHDELIEELRADKRFLQLQLDRAFRQLEDERQRADVLRALGAGTTPDTAANAVESPLANDRGASGVLAWVRRLLGG